MGNNLIKIADIPNYVYKLAGKRPTRQTVYRWIHKGKQLPYQTQDNLPSKLQTKTVLGQLYSTKEFIDIFLERISI